MQVRMESRSSWGTSNNDNKEGVGEMQVIVETRKWI